MQSSDITQENDEDCCSFIVFRHIARNITSMDRDIFHYSPTFRVQQMTWSIAYKVYRPPEHNEDVFGLFIAFKGTVHPSRPMVNMEVELKLINQFSPKKTVTKDFAAFLNTSIRTHLGFKKFMYWHDVITRSVGFIEEDQVTMEVRIAATPPQPDVDSLLSPKPLCIKKSSELVNDKTSSKNLEEVLLSRQLNNCSLQDRGQYLLTSGLGSDCEFLVGKDDNKRSFQASALMLARVSPVFETMFFGELRQTSPVPVPDVQPDAFYKMLQFAYGCELHLGSQEEVMDLYYVADKYLVADLQIACLKHVWPTDVNDVWSALHMATFYGLPSLLTAALKVVGQKIDAVLQHQEFCALSANSLLTLVQAHELKVGSELQLFQAVLRWASASCLRKGITADPTTMRTELEEILPYIRFLSMNQEQFAEDPVTCGLLTTEEKLQCLLAIVHPSLHDPPTTICALRKPRGRQNS
ncbi:hypothetical protein R5R35_014208 [Gryllus longicercus]|uniref:BTB domain-containing protein n=1 Tax=Gryllus longicercus TaxID=2509291 RepID=A0AAN9VSL2_9ORTH